MVAVVELPLGPVVVVVGIVLAVTVRWDGDCTIWMLGLLVVKTLVCCRLTRFPCEPTFRMVPALPVEPPGWFCCCRIWICWGWEEPDELEGVNWN